MTDDCWLNYWLICVCSEKFEQLVLTPINEVTEDDEEDKTNEVEEEDEIGECEEDESEMEFNVPQSHRSSTCLQSLSSEGSSSSTEDSSDTDASASTTSGRSRYSGQDREENTYSSKGERNKVDQSCGGSSVLKGAEKIWGVWGPCPGGRLSRGASCLFVLFQATKIKTAARKQRLDRRTQRGQQPGEAIAETTRRHRSLWWDGWDGFRWWR